MKCAKCGAEHSSRFCPKCGFPGESGSQPPILPAQPYGNPPAVRKKKPFFLRWWFILLAIVVILVVVGKLVSGGKKTIQWSDLVLIDEIPEPPSTSGMVYGNSREELRLSLEEVSDAEYNSYLDDCAEKGFTIDREQTSGSFTAFNEAGYYLELSHYFDNLTITLQAPIAMGPITWPTGTAGILLPPPESTTGKFSYEHDDGFFVYIGDTSREAFAAYVTTCSESGFQIDYSKGDTYYYADNAEGWHLTLNYKGNSIMTIRIDSPVEETPETTTPEETVGETARETVGETTQEATEDTSQSAGTHTGIDPDFKAAMDAYEAFYEEYCTFLKSYYENPSDPSLLIKYMEMVSKVAEMDKSFEEWDEGEMNDEELKYYLDVQTRVLQMLVDAGA